MNSVKPTSSDSKIYPFLQILQRRKATHIFRTPHMVYIGSAPRGGQDPGQWTACRVVVSVFFLRKIDIKLLPGSKIWGGCPIFTNLISFKLVQGSKFMGCIQIFPPLQFKKISVLSNFQLFFLKTFNLFHFSCLLYPYPPLGSTMHKNC